MKLAFKIFLFSALIVGSLSSCKKNPAKDIYKTWNLISAELQPPMDNNAAQEMIASGTSFTFSKDGKYTIATSKGNETGTFTLAEDGKSITTVGAESTEVHTITNLTETTLSLSNDSGKMTFNAKQ